METFPQGDIIRQELTICDIKNISSDSKLFIFALPSPEHIVGLKPGQHIGIKALVHNAKYPDGKEVKRKYTPTSKIDARGTFEIPIKIYFPTETFPGGQLTMHLNTLVAGSKVSILGPIGKFIYEGNGICYFKKQGQTRTFKKFGFIAGGSGITPCFQYIQYIIDHNEDIELSLIYANKSEGDIWLRNQLDEYSSKNKLKLLYTLNHPPENWSHGTGNVSQDMITTVMPSLGDDTCIFFCGPSPMNQMLRQLLPSLGYTTYIKF
ncbi:hypothetical protein SteCoe_3677 [Stentor coeruleus]|uniref:NADH-cytochrome b5 reductase n=1 Tax=Stentor coeruleus TaxID=5963 RepID=A0A1R2CWF2_9CILI|nr:hypothetical protein SteCoe_3677 [Stentor coeruleus]